MPKADNNVSVDSVSQLEMGQHILGQAIEALLQLDQDNQLLSGCIKYLQDLQRVVKEWGKLSFYLHFISLSFGCSRP